jgi:DNA-binding NtrC family response regulator
MLNIENVFSTLSRKPPMTLPIRSVLLAEKDPEQREMLAGKLRHKIDCVVHTVGTQAEAMKALTTVPVCVFIAGLDLEQNENHSLINHARQHHPQMVILPVVPLGDQQALIRALKRGAFSYLNYPYDPGEVVIVSARALHFFDLQIHREKQGRKISKSDGYYGIIGNSSPMLAIFDMIDKLAADGASTVLIQGESGTGKELVARAIHDHSNRQLKNFVPINCAAIPGELMESELFGYRKGAFTGAAQTKTGLIQFADGGTLFLDEIGDMHHDLQAKLLRMLQEKSFVPVGGLEPVAVDVRILSATHYDLEARVAAGQFREDLYYRLSVIPMYLPPLRQREGDIALLLDTFVRIFNRTLDSRPIVFSPEAKAALLDYPWPGNVRELENLVQRLMVLHGGSTIGRRDLPPKYLPSSASGLPPPTAGDTSWSPVIEFGAEGVDFNEQIQDLETRLILQALSLSGGNKKEAARMLNLNRTTLLQKIKKKGLLWA